MVKANKQTNDDGIFCGIRLESYLGSFISVKSLSTNPITSLKIINYLIPSPSKYKVRPLDSS